MNYPYLIQSAWRVVGKLVLDWQNQPYRWEYERDIQVELSSRLSQLYTLINEDLIEVHYDNVLEGYENKQFRSRVGCEYLVRFRYKDGKNYGCHPDVVIFDKPNNKKVLTSTTLPILWACEIKYSYSKPDSWDVDKLEYLINQSQINYGCWLTLIKERAKTKQSINWLRNKGNRKLWICEARLPSL